MSGPPESHSPLTADKDSDLGTSLGNLSSVCESDMTLRCHFLLPALGLESLLLTVGITPDPTLPPFLFLMLILRNPVPVCIWVSLGHRE